MDPDEMVEDLSFLALVDDDADGVSFNDEPREMRLSEFFARNRPGTNIIMVNAAAGWCAPCMAEASAINAFADAYAEEGVVVLTAVIQDHNGDASDLTFTRLWAETYALSIPTLVDSDFVTERYFDLRAMPANLFVDAKTETVLSVAVGTDPGDDPMKEYRELLDHYLMK